MPLGEGKTEKNGSQSFVGWMGNVFQSTFSEIKNTAASTVNSWLDYVELQIHANADSFVKNSIDRETGEVIYAPTPSYVAANFALDTKGLFKKKNVAAKELMNHFTMWQTQIFQGYLPVALFLKAFAFLEKNTSHKETVTELKASLKQALRAKLKVEEIVIHIEKDCVFWKSAHDKNNMTLNEILQAFEFYKDLFSSEEAFKITEQNLKNFLQPEINQIEFDETKTQSPSKEITLSTSLIAIPKAIGKHFFSHPYQAIGAIGLISFAFFLPVIGATPIQQRRASFAPSTALALHPYGGPTPVNSNALVTLPDITAVANTAQPRFEVVWDTKINNGGPQASLTSLSANAVIGKTTLLTSGLAPSVLSISNNVTVTATTKVMSNELIPTITTTLNNGVITHTPVTALVGPAFLPPEVSDPYIIALAYNTNTNQVTIATNRGPQIAVANATINPATGAVSNISTTPTFPFDLPGTVVQSAPNMVIDPNTGKPIIAAYYATGTKGNYRYYVVANFNGKVVQLTDSDKTTGNDYEAKITLNTDKTVTVRWEHGVDGIYQKKFSLDGTALGPQTLIAGSKYANATSAAFSGDCSGYSITTVDDAIKSTAIVTDQKSGQVVTTAEIGLGTHPNVDAIDCVAGVTWKDSSGTAQVATLNLGASSPATPPVNNPVSAPAKPPVELAPVDNPVSAPVMSPVAITPNAPIVEPPIQVPTIAPLSSNSTTPTAGNEKAGWAISAALGVLTIAVLAAIFIYHNRKRKAHENQNELASRTVPPADDSDVIYINADNQAVSLDSSSEEEHNTDNIGDSIEYYDDELPPPRAPKKVVTDYAIDLSEGMQAIFAEAGIQDQSQQQEVFTQFLSEFKDTDSVDAALALFKQIVTAYKEAAVSAATALAPGVNEKSKLTAGAKKAGYESLSISATSPATTMFFQNPTSPRQSSSLLRDADSAPGNFASFEITQEISTSFSNNQQLISLAQRFEQKLGEEIPSLRRKDTGKQEDDTKRQKIIVQIARAMQEIDSAFPNGISDEQLEAIVMKYNPPPEQTIKSIKPSAFWRFAFDKAAARFSMGGDTSDSKKQELAWLSQLEGIIQDVKAASLTDQTHNFGIHL